MLYALRFLYIFNIEKNQKATFSWKLPSKPSAFNKNTGFQTGFPEVVGASFPMREYFKSSMQEWDSISKANELEDRKSSRLLRGVLAFKVRAHVRKNWCSVNFVGSILPAKSKKYYTNYNKKFVLTLALT